MLANLIMFALWVCGGVGAWGALRAMRKRDIQIAEECEERAKYHRSMNEHYLHKLRDVEGAKVSEVCAAARVHLHHALFWSHRAKCWRSGEY